MDVDKKKNMSYVLNKINKKSLELLNENWLEQAESIEDNTDSLLMDVEVVITWCEKNLNNQGDASCFWALYEDGNATPRAIVEMTDARRSRDQSFKLLNIHFEPNLVLDYKEDITREELIESVRIAGTAIVESLKATLQHDARMLKIFARTSQMISLFDSIITNGEFSKNGFKLYRQGKWLIIEPTA